MRKTPQILPIAEEQRNRIWNIRNPFQGDYKKVLCVCSAGMLRSPTAAVVLAKKYNFNTRPVGLDMGHALIPVDQVLLEWADETVCMEYSQEDLLRTYGAKNILNLEIPDRFGYMDSELVQLIEERYPIVFRDCYGIELEIEKAS